MDDSVVIREIQAPEFDLVWPIFREVVAAGDTYSYAPDISFDQAQQLWTGGGTRCFVATSAGYSVGCYMLRANQPGLGNHIANAGYMVAASARDRGIARQLCEHSMAQARSAGFSAMQFNFVVSTNEVAVGLWRKLGFDIVGRIPSAFRHARLGPVDVLVMYRRL
ncbi:MAG: N-acetyltransferase [Rudaea sp.]|nr:N-acetyltransferase [Rudaea sp.]